MHPRGLEPPARRRAFPERCKRAPTALRRSFTGSCWPRRLLSVTTFRADVAPPHVGSPSVCTRVAGAAKMKRTRHAARALTAAPPIGLGSGKVGPLASTTTIRHRAGLEPATSADSCRAQNRKELTFRRVHGSLPPPQPSAAAARMATDVAFMKRGKGNVSRSLSRRMPSLRRSAGAPPAPAESQWRPESAFRYGSPSPRGSPITTVDAAGSTRPIHAGDAQRSTKRRDWVPAEIERLRARRIPSAYARRHARLPFWVLRPVRPRSSSLSFICPMGS